jgi:hypothetical protein
MKKETETFAPITVPVAELAAVAKWAGTDPKQPHLHVVAFRGGEYVALDGTRLVRVPCETHGHEFGIDRTHVLAAVAAHRALHQLHEIDLEPVGPADAQVIALNIGPRGAPASIRVMVPYRRLDAGFPTVSTLDDVMKVERGSTSLKGHGFNPAFLAAIAEVHAADLTPGNHGVRVEAWAHDGRGGVLFRNGKGIRFIVMPIRL